MGWSFAYRTNGGPPVRRRYPLAKSMNGAGTRPAARMRAGDVVVYTTVAALTTAGAKVVRPLLENDKAANYEEGGVRAGILGICDSPVATNSSGAAVAETQAGGLLPKTPGLASIAPLDTNGHSQQTFVIATPDTVFRAQLGTAAANLAAYLALKGGLAGITMTDASGGSDYTINTSDTGEKLMLKIVDVDPNDATFKEVFVSVLGSGLTPTGSYMQNDTQTAYSTQ
jgi:hypothetical protein